MTVATDMQTLYFEQELLELNKRLDKQEIPNEPVLFYGSSSFRLWSTIKEDLGSEDILNLGFGGSTLRACAHYFEVILTKYQPKSLLIYAGDNDLGNGRTPEQIEEAFVTIMTKVNKFFGDIPVGYISIKPSPSKDHIQDLIIKANDLVVDKMTEYANAFYIDIYTPMLDSKGKSSPEYFEEDMLHMNAKGYAIWKKEIEQVKILWKY